LFLGISAFTANAQDADTKPDVAAVEAVTVTGSRIEREGFSSPTPVTVVNADEIERLAPTSTGDILAAIPSFSDLGGSTAGGTRTRGGAIDRANLRGLNDINAMRTLVLVDGRRFVPSGSDGAVDLKLIPSTLIQSVEVVAGGASAAWGSDAIAGVVNFRLKTSLEGTEGSASYGVSERGDNMEKQVSIATGYDLFGGRLHGVAAANYVKNDGVGNQYTRPWGQNESCLLNNTAFATNAQPNFIIASNCHPANQTPGGLIVSGPLKGLAFGPGGTTTTFQFGTVYGPLMVGGGNSGENLSNSALLETPLETASFFTHAEFDLSSNTTLFAELSGAWSHTVGQSEQPRDAGNLTIQRTNAYLPASVVAAMTANNLTTITVGRLDDDTGPVQVDAVNQTVRAVIGAKGALGGGWTWDSYYQYGQNFYTIAVGPNNRITPNYPNAIDAVVNPANGQIVCRSTLTAPTNGCLPLNIFGPGAESISNSYVFGTARFRALTTQQVAEANVRGEPFETWAGPVSFATGLTFRAEDLSSKADPLSFQPNANGSFGEWLSNNQMPAHGSLNVWEIYGETVVPLLNDDSKFGKSLDFNGAVRRTDYNLSGDVVTWKAGLTYKPMDGLLFRGFRSRDIRAPNLGEIFEGGGSNTAPIFDRVLNANVNVPDLSRPNTALKPERADTWSAGVTYKPSWVSGLSFSADYYNVKINGEIATIPPALRAASCYAGQPGACANVIFNPNGTIAFLVHQSTNLNSLQTSGVDFEAVYLSALNDLGIHVPGDISLRLLGSYIGTLEQNLTTGRIQEAGYMSVFNKIYGVPHFNSTQELVYSNADWSVGLLGRLVGSGRYSTALQDGVGAANTINNNNVPTYFLLGLNGEYRFDAYGGKWELFGVINNLLDKDPPLIPSGTTGQAAETATNPIFYDQIGRTYKVGLRFAY
jgi:outer membrane receptor protein involved in Fe transport